MILSRDVNSSGGRQRETFLVDYNFNSVLNSIGIHFFVLKSEQNGQFQPEDL
jgi:hypothetical protein